MGEENQTIDLIKNLPTQTRDERGKPNNSEIRSKWFKNAQDSIFYYREDASNT